MAFIFANNIETTLAGGISSASTSLTLSSTQNLPASIPVGSYLVLTLNDQATRTKYEIVYVTAISGATLTVLRAQEGTAALAWLTGDYTFSGPTAGQMASFQQGGASGVTPGTYGSSTQVPQFTVNAQGQVTAASNVAIAFPITSFNGRAGAIVLNSGDVTTALGYNPVNKAGDTMTGQLTVPGLLVGSGTGAGGPFIYEPATVGTMNFRSGTSGSQKFFAMDVSGDFNVLNGSVKAQAQVWSRGGRVLALAGTPTEFPTVAASGIDMNGTSGRGQVFAFNYATSAYMPMDYNASSHNFNNAVTVTGLLTCTTFNASGSDARVKNLHTVMDPLPVHRLLPFWGYTRKDVDMDGRGPTAQDVQKHFPVYMGGTVPVNVDGETIDMLTIDKTGLAYEAAMWASVRVDELLDRVGKLEAR